MIPEQVHSDGTSSKELSSDCRSNPPFVANAATSTWGWSNFWKTLDGNSAMSICDGKIAATEDARWRKYDACSGNGPPCGSDGVGTVPGNGHPYPNYASFGSRISAVALNQFTNPIAAFTNAAREHFAITKSFGSLRGEARSTCGRWPID